MKAIKIYEVIVLNSDDTCSINHIPSTSSKDVYASFKEAGCGGEIIRVVDVTQKFNFDVPGIMALLSNANIGKKECDVIGRMLNMIDRSAPAAKAEA